MVSNHKLQKMVKVKLKFKVTLFTELTDAQWAIVKKIVDTDTVATFQTGVQYQMYHTLALLAAAILFERFPNKWIKWAGAGFIIGIVLFSGSLYLLTALKATDQVGLKGVGIITPVGGVFFIAGWLFLFLGIMKKN